MEKLSQRLFVRRQYSQTSQEIRKENLCDFCLWCNPDFENSDLTNQQDVIEWIQRRLSSVSITDRVFHMEVMHDCQFCVPVTQRIKGLFIHRVDRLGLCLCGFSDQDSLTCFKDNLQFVTYALLDFQAA